MDPDPRGKGLLEAIERIARISEAMEKAGVLSLLWDTISLKCYGVPTAIIQHAFIVPDESIEVAFEAIKGLDFIEGCDMVPQCPVTPSEVFRTDDPPLKHLHLDQTCWIDVRGGDRVGLYKMSQIFHPQYMPDMSSSSEDIMLASDPSIPMYGIGGYGPFPLEFPPARLLNPHRFAETVIRLCVRDREKERAFSNWHVMLLYMGIYVDHRWGDFFHPDNLRSQFRWFWKKCFRDRPREGDLSESEGFRRLAEKLMPWPSVAQEVSVTGAH